MKILSIETSCDDTSICIFEAKGNTANASFKILAHSSNSQIKIHIPFGGVYPVMAKREHERNLPLLLEEVLKEAKLDKDESPVDAIAVTAGPGLEIALWTGIVFAKELAKKWNVPLIPVNHMEGHIFSVFGKNKPARNASGIADADGGTFKIPKIKTPTLSLLVSGGHTQLILIKKLMKYEIIGESLDDAVGEAFDKVARMLGLPYPGGPEISRLAEERRAKEKEKQYFMGVSQADGPRSSAPRVRGDSDPKNIGFSFSLPRPMLYSKNLDFSYSGLKTAVLYLIKKITKENTDLDEETKSKIALEFENAAIECLVYKTAKAIEKYKIKTLIVAGGVSANQYLRDEMKKMTKTKKVELLFPPKELTGDNSIMIGMAGYMQYIKNKKKVKRASSIKANGNLRLA